jgi:hypothetical protein
VLLATVAAIWAPWVVRNADVFGRFIPLTSQPCPPCTGIYHDGASDPTSPRTFGQWQLIPAPPGLDELESREQRRDRAIRWIREHPGQAATIALAQAGLLWRPAGLGLGSLGVVAWVTSSTLLIAAAFGLAQAWREGHPGVKLWIAAAAALTAFAVLTIGDPRHRLALHPALNVLAAYAIVQALRARSPGSPEAANHHRH